MSSDPPPYIGPYRVDAALGQGGMGEVYKAYDEALKRAVAVKRVRTQRAPAPQVIARFRREARALAAVTHPNVVRIHTIGEAEGGALYLAMDFVEGVSLAAVASGAWPVAQAVGAVHQAASGLGAVHAAGIVHRDVKPDNLLVDAAGAIRVVDFGLAMRPDSMTDQVTADNMLVGTLPYMAPEQLTGQPVGPQADVFALGVILFQLLSGEHPFVRDTRNATALAIVSVSHPGLRELNPDVPAGLAQVVARCMALEPADRFPDGSALVQALTPWAPADMADLARVASEPQAFRDELGGTQATVAATPAALGVETTEPASEPHTRVGWIALLVFVAAVSWWTARVTAQPDSQVRRAVTPIAAEQQTVAVLDFDGVEPGEHRVIADLVRLQLEWAPTSRLRVVPLTGLMRSLPPDAPIDGRLDTAALARPDGSVGQIDHVIQGAEIDGQLVLTRSAPGSRTPLWTARIPLQGAAQTAVAAAEAIAAGLGVALTPGPLPQASETAHAAYLRARAAERVNDYATVDRFLSRAFELAPDFPEAHVMHAGWLRGTGQKARLVELMTTQLARADLHPRQRAYLEAHLAFGQDDVVRAVQLLEDVTRRWPFFVDAHNALLAARFHTRGVRDLGAVELLAQRTLAFLPFGEHAASRLVRALGIRGRADQAAAALQAVGITPETPLSNDVWAELYLHKGRYDLAIARFDRALAKAPQDIYARNLRYGALILAGRCADAAAGLLADVAEAEINGSTGVGDWTVRLALQSLICQRSWAQAQALLDRWEKWGTPNSARASWWRPRLALAQGAAAEDVARQVTEALADAPPTARAGLLRVLARVGQDAAQLEAEAKQAQARAADLEEADRAGWLLAQRALSVRARVLRGQPPESATLVLPWGALRTEREQSYRVEAMALHAETLAATDPAAARAVWAELAALGYPRLYATDLYLLADASR